MALHFADKILWKVQVMKFIMQLFLSSCYFPTGWTTGIQFPAEAGNFYPRHCVQTTSGAHPASYTMATGGSWR
jgi:hypothetical protein